MATEMRTSFAILLIGLVVVEAAFDYSQVACGIPPDVAGGYVWRKSYSTKTVSGVTLRTDVIIYNCTSGAAPVGNATLACYPNTVTWTGPPPTCPGATSGSTNTGGTSSSSTSGTAYTGPTSGPLYGPQCRYGLALPHSICLPDLSPPAKLEAIPIDEVLNRHNYWRGLVSPPAAQGSMPILKYDLDLAATAERWAAQCPGGHDSSRALPDRGTKGPAWSWVGQNICYSSGYSQSWTQCIDNWASELKNWQYSIGAVPSTAVVGHYTQVVWSKTLFVGCGKAKCATGGWEYVMVCNYGPGGNVGNKTTSAYAYPYTKA